MGGDLLHRKWILVAAIFLSASAGCSDDELDGPQRTEYDGVDTVFMDVDRGDVMIFGSEYVDGGAIVDRWISSESGFGTLDQRNTGRELVIDSRCESDKECRSRFDLAVNRSAAVDATLRRGNLQLVKLGGDLRAVVDNGEIKASGLRSSYADVTIDKGHAKLKFQESPRDLRLHLGADASAKITVPEDHYDCRFDQEAEQINIDGVECIKTSKYRITIEPPDASVRLVAE